MTRPASVSPEAMSAADDLRGYLDTLYADAPGYVHVCRTGNWVGRGYPTTVDGLDEAAAAAISVDASGPLGVYIRATTLREPPTGGKRGSVDDSAAVLFFVGDLDIAGPGHAAANLPPDEASARRIVTESCLPDPTIWVHSGGGLYSQWVLDEPCTDLEAAAELSNDIQAELVRSAAQLGWSYGDVGDLARVIRAPGTTNRKPGVNAPCRVLSDDGERYSFEELREFVPSAPSIPAELPRETPSASSAGERGPFAALQDTATWADLFKPAGWEFVGGESDGAERWKRPGASSEYSARCGYNGVPVAVVHSTDAGLPSGEGQRLTKGRLFAWLHHDGDMTKATVDLRAAARGLPATRAALALPVHVLEAIAATTTPSEGDMPPAPTTDVEEAPVAASWSPIDLGPHLDGTFTAPEATYLERKDGVALFYAGLVHWVYGESESGKSWVCLIATARVLDDGGRALFVDYESDPGAIVGRLKALGVKAADIARGLTYVRPETSCLREPAAFGLLLQEAYDIAVVDGVTIGLGIEGGATNDTDDVSTWTRRIPLRIARATGAAVACVDHVTKDKDGRGRFPVGSQAKLAAIDGAGYLVEPITAIRPGAVGEIVMRVAKDRPGGVRAEAGEWRQGDRTQEAARLTLDATDPTALTVVIEGPSTKASDASGGGKFTPTVYMEKVSRFLATTEGEASTKTIETEVDGRADMIRKALSELALLGYVTRRQGPRNAVLYSHVKRYTDLVREANDEVLSDDDD